MRPQCTEQQQQLGSDAGRDVESRGDHEAAAGQWGRRGLETPRRLHGAVRGGGLYTHARCEAAAGLRRRRNFDQRRWINAAATRRAMGLAKFIKLLAEAALQSVRAVSEDGANALALAVQGDKVDAVKVLLKLGMQVDESSSTGRSPLMLAAAKGRVEVLKLLLEKVADPNKMAEDGNTALTFAAEIGHVEAVRTLLSHGARVNRSSCPEVAPLVAAAQNKRLGVMKLLL